MVETHRVIITGNNARAKSAVVADKQVEVGGVLTYDFWQTRPGGPLDDVAFGTGPMKFYPQDGGTNFRYFEIPAATTPIPPEQFKAMVDGFFGFVGPAARVDTSRHPFMHTTPTLDYIILLRGEISLQLDEGDAIPLKPLDTVVQRGTNHSWVNTGEETALLMAVMVGGK
jgi:hypothetical protein